MTLYEQAKELLFRWQTMVGDVNNTTYIILTTSGEDGEGLQLRITHDGYLFISDTIATKGRDDLYASPDELRRLCEVFFGIKIPKYKG